VISSRVTFVPSGIASLAVLLAMAPVVPATGQEDPARLVYLLQYIAADYGRAVQEGRVANEFEHQELIGLSRRILEEYRALRGPRASESIVSGAGRLERVIRERRPWDQVRALARDLVARLSAELGIRAAPSRLPDLARGRELYDSDCAPCHGARGDGDGWAAPGQEPPPASFRDGVYMNLVSPHQVTGATRFGVPGTAMPSYGGAYGESDLWDVAFFAMTLRGDFDPRPPASPSTISLDDLARSTNEELIERGRASGTPVDLGSIDFLRENLPAAGETSQPATVATAPGDAVDGLELALRLESVFAQVAERVFPSVAGITLYRRTASSGPKGPPGGKKMEAWQQAGQETDPYPGFRRIRSGSGVFVTDDGFLLTSARLLAGEGGRRDGDIIDVELQDNQHARARLIGLEPAVDLAVLKTEAPIAVRPARLGDSDAVRVGQWAIAVGDPPGVEKTFSPGTIAARPERDCYQENRTSTLLQTSIRVGPESLGGPLVNIRGEVIGIAVPQGQGPSAAGPADAVHALPINLAMTIYEALKVKESKQSPWLGFSVLDLTADVARTLPKAPLTGIYIEDVFEPSPAARAGIRVGDVLTAMDGNRIFAVPDFQKWIYLLGIGHAVRLELVRGGGVLERTLTIEQRPPTTPTR